MRVAVIPARGGSKRIPGKNIRPFHGKPILAYSIEAARASGLFERVVVSTDDDAIGAVALAHGAEVPFRRPPELSDDHTGTNPVVAHALEWLARERPVAQACCLYATAPFVTADDLRAAHARLADDVDFVFAAARFAAPVQRALQLDPATGRVQPMFPQWIGHRSQDLAEAVHDAGQFYWARPDAFRRHRVAFEARAVAHVLPSHRVQDIDTLEDWARAERLYRLLMDDAACA